MSLAPLVVEQIRELSAARREAAVWRLIAQEAIAALAEADRKLKSARSTIEFQRLELRALMSGRTIAEQRQADDTDSLSVANEYSTSRAAA